MYALRLSVEERKEAVCGYFGHGVLPFLGLRSTNLFAGLVPANAYTGLVAASLVLGLGLPSMVFVMVNGYLHSFQLLGEPKKP